MVSLTPAARADPMCLAEYQNDVGTPLQVEVDIQPIGRRVIIPAGQTVLHAAIAGGVELLTLCGGNGWCEQCRVQLVSGSLSAPTGAETAAFDEEELRSGWRLACQARALSSLRIYVPPGSLTTSQRLQLEGQQVATVPDPVVEVADVTLEEPDLHDVRSDATRVLDALSAAGTPASQIALPLLESLSEQLRVQSWQARFVVRGQQLVALLPRPVPVLGLAIDIGTTKIAAYLLDLATAETLASVGAMNPQIPYGEDVISRIAYANTHGEGGRAQLRSLLVERINEMVGELCTQAGAQSKQIVEVVLVGNTCMHHLLSGLPVKQLGQAPYVAALTEALDVGARELGLAVAPGARAYLPPNIAGYVGADHVAMLLASEIWRASGTVLALDIGTNTEISLSYRGQLFCCSSASGPAFEGAHISAGMRAAPGAVERVQIRDGLIRVSTIGGQPAIGICGSGMLDVLGEMVQANVLDGRGMMNRTDPRVRHVNGLDEFELLPASATGNGRALTINRKDVHEVQLAKGAIRGAVELLLSEAGVSVAAIDEIIVAGAFGTYLDPNSAMAIGMFPRLPLDRFRQIGNAAGTGARQILLSANLRGVAEKLARQVRYVELTTHPEFQARFLDALSFP